MHFEQSFRGLVESALQLVQVKVEGRARVPIFDVHQEQHLPYVIGVLQLHALKVKGCQNATNFSHVGNVLLLERHKAEFRHTWVFLLHVAEVVEIAVALHQVDQGLHGCRVNASQLRVELLLMLLILLVPLLQL